VLRTRRLLESDDCALALLCRPSRPTLIRADGTTLAAPETGQINRAARFGRLTGRGQKPSLDAEFYLLISCYDEQTYQKGVVYLASLGSELAPRAGPQP